MTPDPGSVDATAGHGESGVALGHVAAAGLVVATAGHVDHGKSSLVRALTGTDPDRLAEEQRRGLTLDLGFASCRLPSGRILDLVDVPGHERYVATMLSGLGPATAVLLVVAADRGWQAQTQEHLDAVVALGLPRVVVAVTRSDLADPEPVRSDALARLAAVGLADSCAAAVASPPAAQGTGHHDLLAALDRLDPTPEDAPLRLWVDRAFSVKGRGQVVTATLAHGRLARGDLLTAGREQVLVRGLQVHGRDVEQVVGPARVGLRVDGDLLRGTALVRPDEWLLTDLADVQLHGPLRATGALHAHLGSADVPVTVRPLGPDHARLRLARPLPLRVGDRLVLRDPGGLGVLAGATTVDVDPPPLRRRGAAAVRAEALAGGLSPETELERRGVVRPEHLRLLGFGPPAAALDVAGWLVLPDHWSRLVEGLRALVADSPEVSGGPTTSAAAHALALPPALVGPLAASAGLRTAGGRVVRPASGLGPAENAVREVEARLARAALDAPDRGELARLGLGPRELAAADRAGRLLRLGPDVVVLPSAPALAVRRLAALHPPWTVGAAARALGSSRRVVVPLLEHLDATGLTRREGAVRQVV